MELYKDFDAVFAFNPDYTYEQTTIRDILRNRQDLGGHLFIDRLLDLLHIKQASKLFPPRTNGDLRTLFTKIASAPETIPSHHIQSLLFYIFLDCSPDPALAYTFADNVYLPSRYRIYIEGLWHMDALAFEKALSYLCKPGLVPTFPEEILDALVQHAPRTGWQLPLVYWHVVAPVLTTTHALETIFKVYCNVGVTDAFFFARTQAEHMHHHLFEQLVAFVLELRAGDARATKCVELVNLPMSPQESGWFEGFLSGKGKTLMGAKDTLMIRRIGIGKFDDALSGIRGVSGREMNGLKWDLLKGGVERGLGPRYSR